MIAERIEWQRDAALGFATQRVAYRGREQFWQPVPERTQEFSCSYLDGGCAAPHVHEEWQFAVAAEPSTITLGAFRRYRALADDVTVVSPYDVHTERGWFGAPRGWLVLHVAKSVVEQACGDEAGRVPRFDGPVIRDGKSARSLAPLLQSSLEGSIGSCDFTTRVLEWLHDLLGRYARGTAVPAIHRAPIERARAYLQSHATEPLSLSELAGVAGVTTSHLVRSFSRSVGLPPKSYHAQLRLARARRLLAEGRPATWVAYECGFADQSHLNRRFKEFYGLTPGAFQAHYHGRQPSTAVLQSTGSIAERISFNAA
jgi:AraC-like DNA-binding protein